jgi:hypothetical protein
MPNYIEQALLKYMAGEKFKITHSPHQHVTPTYGAKVQYTAPTDTSAPLDKAGITRLQCVIGTLLYYARAIDNTMLVALGSLSSAQSKGTERTALALTQLLNYAATHPDAALRYHASDMQLRIHTDASYLSETKARSRAGGFMFLSSNPLPPGVTTPPINGAILIVSSIMDQVLSSATEAEVGAAFYVTKEAVSVRNTLTALGHTQGSTPIECDNQCATGIMNDTVKQKRSKAMDMRFYWLRDRV